VALGLDRIAIVAFFACRYRGQLDERDVEANVDEAVPMRAF
jgi:hypothetical protein